MNPRLLAVAIVCFLVPLTSFAQVTPSADEVVADIVSAADALLETLTPEQREDVIFSFADAAQRRRWSNLPVGIVERRGLRMGDLDEPQRQAVLGVLRATLSERGFQQVIDNMNGDEVLNQNGGRGRVVFGKDEYFFSILGTPSTTEPWMWQFGGHHLAINATIAGERITLSPSLTGGQPVDYEFEGKQIRQLAGDEDKAFAFVGALTEEQLAEAVLDDHHADLAFGPDAKSIEPKQEGIPASKLTDEQQQMLLDLIEERIGILNPTHAEVAMRTITDQLADTYFAWFGPTAKDSVASFRIQGPSVIIEYAPQHLGGDATQHTHAMYRDPTNDYGAVIEGRR